MHVARERIDCSTFAQLIVSRDCCGTEFALWIAATLAKAGYADDGL
jgi:hypothetical protein